MEGKKFDVIGIGHPCVDYLIHIDSLPEPNESRSAMEASWQCGGKVTTGLAAAARCGLSCALIGAMGDDLFGRYCRHDFENHNIDLSQVKIRKGKTTDLAVVLSEEQTNGRNIIYRRGDYERLSLKELDFSFMQNGTYLFIAQADDLHIAAARQAKKYGLKVLIDADNQPLSYYKEILPYIDFFIASEFVYHDTYGEDSEYKKHMEEILHLGPEVVVFTFGGKGCKVYSKEAYYELPAYSVPVVDTVGAGDTFHGAFFYGLTHGYCLKDTALFASAVSAIKCTCIGGRAGIPTPDITLRFMQTGMIDDTPLKERVKQYSWGVNEFFKEVTNLV